MAPSPPSTAHAQRTHRLLVLFTEYFPDLIHLHRSLLNDVLPVIPALAHSPARIPRAEAYAADLPTLFRALRRHKFSVPEALAALKSTLQWRLTSDLDLLSPTALDPLYVKSDLFYFHDRLRDKFGRPCGVLNLREVKRTEDGGLDGLKEFIAWGWEMGRRWCWELSQEGCTEMEQRSEGAASGDGETEAHEDRDGTGGKVVLQMVVIVDLKDAGMSNLEMELLPYFLDLLKSHFPGMVSTIYVLNYNWLHAGMWALAKRILPAQALERIIFPSPDDLRAAFGPEALLAQHGGTFEYTYDCATNPIVLRHGRALLPAPSPALSRRSSIDSISSFYSAASFSRAHTPTSSRPTWLSITPLPETDVSEALEANQSRPGSRPAHSQNYNHHHEPHLDDEINRVGSLRDFRLHLPQGIPLEERVLRVGNSESESSSGEGSEVDGEEEEFGSAIGSSRRSSRATSRSASRGVSREPSPWRAARNPDGTISPFSPPIPITATATAFPIPTIPTTTTSTTPAENET